MKRLLTLISLSAVTLASVNGAAAGVKQTTNGPVAIRNAPPAPKFTDAERQTELAARRAKVFAEMQDDSMMILFSATPKVYTNDVDFMYRQENNLYYLTNLKQPSATLVLVKSGGRNDEILFIPKRNPQFEAWNGKMYSNEEAMRISGLQKIVNAGEFESFLTQVRNKQTFTSSDKSFTFTPTAANLYLLAPFDRGDARDTREFQREWDLAKSLSNAVPDDKSQAMKYEKTGSYQIVSAHPIFEKLRLIKSPYEIRLMQHAVDISIEAHMRAQATVKQVRWEYETQAEIEYVFRRRNADYWGYPSIVGCGPNATTLHYVESQSEVKPGNLFLIDVGAEYDHVTADITRTFPVNGKFTKEQAEIYQLVFDAQEAAAKTMKPGGKFGDPGVAARKTIEDGLIKLGLITGPGAFIPGTERDVPDGKGGTMKLGTPQSFMWFMHGLGHWLGMNVHDVGGGSPTVFKPGMIMTNEPGIYIREDALDYFDTSKPEIKAYVDKIRPAFEKYKNIGVRIEDDMLITENGVEWMSKALPRTIADIERFMKKASGTIRVSAVEPQTIPRLAFLGGETDLLRRDSDYGFFSNEGFSRGKTVRRGWTSVGKEITHAAHNHAE